MTDTTNDPAHDASTQTHEHTNEHTGAQTAPRDDEGAPHVTVPADSGIVGGAPADATDIGTSSGTSGSGGG